MIHNTSWITPSSQFEAALDEISSGDSSDSDRELDSDASSIHSASIVDDQNETSSANIVWKKVNIFVPKIYQFCNRNKGIKTDLNLNSECSELEFFEIYFPTTLMNNIVKETNAFYVYEKQRLGASSTFSRITRWVETNVAEMYVFFGLIMLMAHNIKKRIVDYWSTDSLIETPAFRNRKFSLLLNKFI